MRIRRTALYTALLTTMTFNVSATWFEDIDSSHLRSAIQVENIVEHLVDFQEIADENDGNRASGLPGFDLSANYVRDELFDAGYQVSVQPFEFPYFQELSEPELEQISPNYIIYPARDPDGFYTMLYSGSSDVIAAVEPVDLVIPPGEEPNTSTSGCEPEDFDNFVPGSIALIQRGTCTFATKAINAENAGAAGVVIFNEGQEGRTDAILGTLGEPVVEIPVVGAAYAIGEELYLASLSNVVTVHMYVDAMTEIRSTFNIIAETVQGRDDRVVVIGAHLDSVPEGPGINDNGSGVATILEIALQMAELEVVPVNKVRFAFWGAEEVGLLGSQYYVDNLSVRERNDIALNLNFDMIGSPNYVRFVYDGDGSDTELEGPKGSENIEQVFLNYFEEQDLPVEPTPFDGRSDYGPFIDVGIPAGGLFTGADGIKTEEEADVYGGTAGEPYDPYYHTPTDDLNNINTDALDQMSDAAAHAVFYYAKTYSFDKETGASYDGERETVLWRGSRLQK